MTARDAKRCIHCAEERNDTHPDEHAGLCCDCFDLSWFPEKLDEINADRAGRGRGPLNSWPKRERGTGGGR